MVLGRDLEWEDHLTVVLASCRPHSGDGVLLVAANAAFADGIIKEFISGQASDPCRKTRILVEAPPPGGKEATGRPALSYVGETIGLTLVDCVRATAGSLMDGGERLNGRDASSEQLVIAPGGAVKVIRDALDLEIANFLFRVRRVLEPSDRRTFIIVQFLVSPGPFLWPARRSIAGCLDLLSFGPRASSKARSAHDRASRRAHRGG